MRIFGASLPTRFATAISSSWATIAREATTAGAGGSCPSATSTARRFSASGLRARPASWISPRPVWWTRPDIIESSRGKPGLGGSHRGAHLEPRYHPALLRLLDRRSRGPLRGVRNRRARGPPAALYADPLLFGERALSDHGGLRRDHRESIPAGRAERGADRDGSVPEVRRGAEQIPHALSAVAGVSLGQGQIGRA